MSEEHADRLTALIGDIAVKHGIAVDRHDPILMLHTINTRLLADSEKAQHALLAQFKAELEGLSKQWADETTRKAERIVNASLAASTEAMKQQMKEGAKDAATALRTEVRDALSLMAGVTRSAQRLGAFNLVTTCLTLLAALLVSWAMVH